MTLDNMTGITKGSYTGFCKSQLITCNFVKACNGVCPFEDALKHADQMQTMNDQHTVDHDRDWIIGCIEHDGFIHTHRFDKANQIIHDALSAEARPTGEWTITLTDDGFGGENTHLICSVCGSEPLAWSSRKFFRYCPSCGAKMGGGDSK